MAGLDEGEVRRPGFVPGFLVGSLVTGVWLWCLIAAARVNSGELGAVVGWGILIPAGVGAVLIVPLFVAALLGTGVPEGAALALGSPIGGALGVTVFFLSSGSSETPALVMAVGAALMIAVAIAGAWRSFTWTPGEIALAVAAVLAGLTVLVPAAAPLIDPAGTWDHLGLVEISAPLGLGAGLGAGAASAAATRIGLRNARTCDT